MVLIDDLVDSNLLHVLMILFVVVLGFLVFWLKAYIIEREEAISKLFGFSILFLWLVYNSYNLFSDTFRIEESLPLHVCDLLAVTSVWMLLNRNRKSTAFLYFCALPLAGQAIITPTGEQNPLLFRFWLFWLLHASIIVSFVYSVVIRKYRPTVKDYLFTVVFDGLYILIILPIDILFDFNYGFIGNSSPGIPTMLDVFGVWPQRVVWMFLAVIVVQFLMLLPSFYSNRAKKK